MNYFFYPEILTEGFELILSDEESRHAVKVLRLSKGSFIQLINGLGQSSEAEITEINGNRITVTIHKVKTEKKPGHELSIAIAVLKKRDRLEWFIEKAVELAADKIFIFSSQHAEKSNPDTKRLHKIAITALKQSGNLWMPEIITGIGFQDVASESYTGSKFIAHCRDEEKQLLKDVYHSSESAIVLIGPEGDFSEPEINLANKHGFVPVSLGNLRLRAETAALTALITMQIADQ